MKKFLFLLFILIAFICKSQENFIYKDIDSLLENNTMIDALTALKKLKENYQKDSINSRYWSNYSKASYIVYNYDNAKIGIEKAIQLSPKNAQYYFEKGFLFNKIGELEPALEALDKAVTIEQDGKYIFWKGVVNQQLGKSNVAEKDYQKALDLYYKSTELYVNYAILLSRRFEYSKGLEMVNKALNLDNKHPHAYATRATIKLFLLNVDGACADGDTALNLGYSQALQIPSSICNGTPTEKLQFVAGVLASNKQYKQSIIAYTKLINAKSVNPVHFLNRGYCYYQLKDFEKAEKDYLKGLTLENPELDKFYDNLSLLYFDQNKLEKSIEYSTQRIELNPENFVAYLDRGLSYRKLKKYKRSEEDFNTSLKIKPNFFRAFGYRAYLNLELGKNQKALDDAKKSVKINPKYAYGYLLLAQAKQVLGIPDFCKDYLAAKKYGWGDEADIAIDRFCK